MLAERKKSL